MRLQIVSERTGKEIGWIRLAGDTASFSGPDAKKLFETYRDAGGWSPRETFDALGTGWSNGYVTIPARDRKP